MSNTPLYDLAIAEFPKQKYPLLLWQGLVKQLEEENFKLKAEPVLSHPPMIEGFTLVPCVVGSDGWLYIPHADNRWVTAAKLEPFSFSIIKHWLKEQPASQMQAYARAAIEAIAQPVPPTSNALKSAREIGEKGTPHSESERLLFEEYMQGHCWKCDSWVASKAEYYDPTQRILYAVFRARAAITQPVPQADNAMTGDKVVLVMGRYSAAVDVNQRAQPVQTKEENNASPH